MQHNHNIHAFFHVFLWSRNSSCSWQHAAAWVWSLYTTLWVQTVETHPAHVCMWVQRTDKLTYVAPWKKKNTAKIFLLQLIPSMLVSLWHSQSLLYRNVAVTHSYVASSVSDMFRMQPLYIEVQFTASWWYYNNSLFTLYQNIREIHTLTKTVWSALQKWLNGELYTAPFSVGHKLLNPVVDHMEASCPSLQWVGTYLQTDGRWH